MSPWLAAAIAVVGGIAVGTVAAWGSRRLGQSGPADAKRVANPAGAFLFWFFTFVGVVVAVGIVTPGTLETVPTQILEYLPRVLAAGLILLATWGLAAVLGRLVRSGVTSTTGGSHRALEAGVRLFVLTLGSVFAIAQLGIDTTILSLLVAGLVGFGALSAALLVGFGGRKVAAEIAAGRYLARHVGEGESIVLPNADSFRVVSIHPAMIELEDADGDRHLVPFSALLESGFVSKRD